MIENGHFWSIVPQQEDLLIIRRVKGTVEIPVMPDEGIDVDDHETPEALATSEDGPAIATLTGLMISSKRTMQRLIVLRQVYLISMIILRTGSNVKRWKLLCFGSLEWYGPAFFDAST
jgi:hypothetical protein